MHQYLNNLKLIYFDKLSFSVANGLNSINVVSTAKNLFKITNIIFIYIYTIATIKVVHKYMSYLPLLHLSKSYKLIDQYGPLFHQCHKFHLDQVNN